MNLIAHWFWTLGPGNPVLARIVHGGSRRLRHLWARMAYLGGLILLVMIGLTTGSGMSDNVMLTDLAKAGNQVFVVIAYGQVVGICLLAPLFMAGVIASEQSGRTYEILLTTPLSNLQIVLGSLMGRLFFVLALLASGLPLFSVLLIFGGTPISAVFAAFAIAGLSAITVGAVAITLAVLRTGGRKAVFTFVVSVVAYLILGYAVDLLLRLIASDGLTTWLTPLHPLLVLETFTNRANYAPPAPEQVSGLMAPLAFYRSQPFAAFSMISGGLSAGLVLWAALRARALEPGEGLWRRRLREWLRLPVGRERRRAPREVKGNPVAWREANTRGRGVVRIVSRWSYVIVCVLLGAGLLLLYHRSALPRITDAQGAVIPQHVIFRWGITTLLLVEVAIVTLIAVYMSASSVTKEREDGTLDLMLTTPISPRFYIWGKLSGLVRFLALLISAPVATLALVSLYAWIGEARQWPGAMVSYSVGQTTARYPLMLPEAPLLLAMLVAPYVAFCVALGMRFSLRSRTVLAAVAWCVSILGVIALPLAFCGLATADRIPLLGPAINALSPATNILMIVNPFETTAGFLEGPGVNRVWLTIVAGCAAAGYAGAVYGVILEMITTFDFVVRKLSGAN